MRNAIIAIVLSTIVAVTCFGTWEKLYGDRWEEYAWDISPTLDNGYIVAGMFTVIGHRQIYVLRLNSYGDTLWTRVYGYPGIDIGLSAIQTSDLGYAICGYTDSDSLHGAGSMDAYLLKLDSDGDTLWTKTLGIEFDDYGFELLETGDGGLVLAGHTDLYGWGGSFPFLIKVDSMGDTVWSKIYESDFNCLANCIAASHDGGCFLGGWIEEIDMRIGMFAMRVDSLGDTLWTKKIIGDSYDYGYSIVATGDDGCVLAGCTFSGGAVEGDVLIVKLDCDGDTIWTKAYGGLEWDQAYSIAATPDGGFIVTGYTDSYGAGYRDLYLLRLDSFGDTLWTRVYGGPYSDEGKSVLALENGSFVVAGNKGFSVEDGESEAWIFETDSLGFMAIDEHDIDLPSKMSISAHPNPFNGNCRIMIDDLGMGIDAIEIYDINGRMVDNMTVGEGLCALPREHTQVLPYDFIWAPDESLGSGIYLVRAKVGGQSITKRIVYLK